MSWHFSRALVAAYSAGSCSDGGPSAPLRSTPTPEPSLPSGKTTAASILSRSGTTSQPLTAGRGEGVLTWCLEDSRARTSASLERVPASAEREADCGEKCGASWAKYDPATSSWKTHQLSLLGDWEPCSETWPRWGTMRAGECWELSTLVRRIDGTASGLWPTPTVCGNHNAKGASATSGDGLATAVARFPTPAAQDAKNSTLPPSQRERDSIPGMMLRTGEAPGGQLNPSWVEWLMGWPIGWTDCAQSATDKFQQWPRSHGACCP